jgi:archaellum component FlaG (FlaF/FlaG flagellin family)
MAENEQEVKQETKQETQSEAKNNQQKKSPWGKIIGVIVAILLVIAMMSGLKGDSLSDSSLGDAKTVDGLQYSLVKLDKSKEDGLEEGYSHLNATIKVKNVGDETASYTNNNFIMLNGQGEAQDQDMPFMKDGTHMTSNEELEPGESAEQVVTWKIKDGVSGHRIRFFKNYLIINDINGYEFEWSVN